MLRPPGKALLGMVLAGACARSGGAEVHYADPEAMIVEFEQKERDTWQRPEEVVDALPIPSKSAVIAEIGAGSGYFTRRLAARVPDGRVYAVDVEAKFERHLEQMREAWGLPNIVPHLAHYEDPMLPDGSVDLVFSANTYSYLSDRTAYFRKVWRALRPGGRLAIIDFRPDATPPTRAAPPPRKRVPEAAVIAEVEAAGFRLARREDFLPHQYFLLFERLDAGPRGAPDAPRSP